MIEGDGGVLDNDATMEGDMFHDQGSAVIMKAHSTCGVYADCHIQVLEKESRALQYGRRRAERFKRAETLPSTSKDRIVCLWGGLVRTLDIPNLEALE